MEVIDWIAILGALAWTPHLFSLAKQYITKAEIRIITQRTASVGFTTYGPIFNIGIAFSVKNKDIVVSDLEIRVKHESGEEKVFVWQGIKQQVGKMTLPDASSMPFEKEQSVLAIKLNQKEIEERFIQCQETSFIASKQEYETAAVRKIAYLRSEDKYNAEEFLRSQEMTELYSFIKHEFPWKQGKYTVTINLSSPEKFDIVDNELEFLFTHLDVENLSKNTSLIELDYRRMLVPSTEKQESIPWQWRNPTLTKT